MFQRKGQKLNVQQEVWKILDEVLRLNGRVATMDREAPLLGALPELDSLAVVAVITSLEDRFGFTIEDDELDGSNFATVGALSDFVMAKVAQ